MGEDTFDLIEYCYELDADLANVMPDSWEGHARIAAFEASEELAPKQRDLSVRLAERIVERYDATAEKAATLATEKAAEKFV